ncbi:sterol desaturase family protein [Janibacter cremeus]|uniref:Sterol desaturase/sphingolipid hydroxylase (Fatty acid hydroxylase superfamily) n=1 Tax=Janibacter cremeus TaxID=1285192 RepID=A0A852VXD4_9MICO|nr:sterol desaturase family protein [Janibacter cremeus]NYF98435.1 sterol desaturase/sphingolipid hydroxylase (fatty acid hydroxylase superfamily) [Janibacter cremeus]
MQRPDLTVLAIPAFIGAMGAEYWWQRRNPAAPGTTRAGDYELGDTIASLTMGVGSLVAPFVTGPVVRRLAPGRTKGGAALLPLGAAAGVVTTVGDVVRRRRECGGQLPEAGTLPSSSSAPVTVRSRVDALSLMTSRSAVVAVGSTAVAAASIWALGTSATRLTRVAPVAARHGALTYLAAIAGWDFIYYWNHRLSHESRWLWAVHVVHHSSERYNLSTALRQPVAEAFTMALPYGVLTLAGIPPRYIEDARAINLIYQFWIHTEAVRSIGWLEKVLNTPSHHRAHHGSQRQYLDINHGSILILWDKLFGTFEPEGEPVRYGLTSNIDSYHPAVIATHEWRDIAADVADATTWAGRFGFLLRGPGWAYARREELASAAGSAAPHVAQPVMG